MSTPSLLVLLLLTGSVATYQPFARDNAAHQTSTQGSDTGSGAPCLADTGQSVTVTRHCFGSMPVDSSLGFLAVHFPDYRVDTTLLETTPVVVWLYKVRGDTAMLSQQADSMDLSSPAYEWRIWGEGILLRGGVPLPMTWGELRSHFSGDAYVTGGELGSQVEIYELNGVRIDLGRGEDLSGPPNLVDPATVVGQVVIYPTRRDSRCH